MQNIFGCFVQIGFDPDKSPEELQNSAEMFRPYIWGQKGICDKLKTIDRNRFGKDLELVLFEFYVNPTENEIKAIKEIGRYRKSEKSIGIRIIVTNENFFTKTEGERFNFLKQSIANKINSLENVIQKNKLDTDVTHLKASLEYVLQQIE